MTTKDGETESIIAPSAAAPQSKGIDTGKKRGDEMIEKKRKCEQGDDANIFSNK